MRCDLQKKTSLNTLKIYRNIYRKNLSAIIYRLYIYRYRYKEFRFIDFGNAQCFFDIIGYRYRFNTERFIVPITKHSSTNPDLSANSVPFE